MGVCFIIMEYLKYNTDFFDRRRPNKNLRNRQQANYLEQLYEGNRHSIAVEQISPEEFEA